MDPPKLTNSLILEIIFGRLGINEQKEFRLVNRTWKDATVKKWRRSALVTININAGKGAIQDKRGPLEFIKLWKSRKHESRPIKDFPFRRFKLCLKHAENATNVPELPQLWDFWKHCSPKMEYLEIDGLPCNQLLQNTIKWLLLKRCEELKELVLTFHFSYQHQRPFSWLLIGYDHAQAVSAFSTAKHLTSLTVRCKDPDSDYRYRWRWDEMEEGYRHPQYLSLGGANIGEFEERRANFFKNLENVASWTRSIKKLALVINNETLYRICELWPKLEELTLLEHSTVTEDGIEQAKRINGALKITRE